VNERNFKIGAREFKLLKIDTFKQWHIARRLGPIIGDIIPVAQRLKPVFEQQGISETEKFEAVAKLFQPIMNGLSKLSDADSDFILLGLCSSVEMKNSGVWSRVVHEKAGLMFQDLELPELLQIAGRAFQFNLAGFFKSNPQISQVGA
jgi:hypothetical protein